MTPECFREAVEDGSISASVAWQSVSTGDVVSVPSGTIHAIGADLIIAEIQQRSDTTYRIFDHGRKRELHVESAIAVADTGPVVVQARPIPLTDERTLLVSNAHFVFERICLAPGTMWWLEAARETWLLVLSGGARVGSFNIAAGDAIFAQSDRVNIDAGPDATCRSAGVYRCRRSGRRRPPALTQPGSTDLKLRRDKAEAIVHSPPQRPAIARNARKASDEATTARCIHRQLSSAALRYRNLHVRSHIARSRKRDRTSKPPSSP